MPSTRPSDQIDWMSNAQAKLASLEVQRKRLSEHIDDSVRFRSSVGPRLATPTKTPGRRFGSELKENTPLNGGGPVCPTNTPQSYRGSVGVACDLASVINHQATPSRNGNITTTTPTDTKTPNSELRLRNPAPPCTPAEKVPAEEEAVAVVERSHAQVAKKGTTAFVATKGTTSKHAGAPFAQCPTPAVSSFAVAEGSNEEDQEDFAEDAYEPCEPSDDDVVDVVELTGEAKEVVQLQQQVQRLSVVEETPNVVEVDVLQEVADAIADGSLAKRTNNQIDQLAADLTIGKLPKLKSDKIAVIKQWLDERAATKKANQSGVEFSGVDRKMFEFVQEKKVQQLKVVELDEFFAAHDDLEKPRLKAEKVNAVYMYFEKYAC